ncbi:MAG: hypothetical protein IJZ98_05655 [Bacteroidales bacterium]|nr:hypothetical protein [Bacteroidales bacterium]
MDIDLLSKMVKELILDNDRVILPGLGSFVAEMVPSTFSDKGYTINPPYRRLFFRSKPDQGSGLAEFYASSNKVEKEVAEKIITDYVSELKSVLHTRKVVVFPGLGRLRATKENNVFFIADEDLDIYPDGFGLEPISLKTHQETPEEVSAAMTDLKSLLADPVMKPEKPAATDAKPETEPVAELAKPDAKPEPTPVAEPSEPETAVEPESIPAMEPLPATVAEPSEETNPAAELEVAVLPDVMPKDETLAETHAEKVGRPVGKTLLAVALIIIVILALLLAAWAIVGRMCPEFVDRFLYTTEELEILNRTL